MPSTRSTTSAPVAIGPLGVAALLASAVMSAMAIVAVAVLLPAMAKTFSATPHAALLTQLAAAMSPFTLAIGAPVMGRLIDRFGYRPVYLGGLIVFAAAGCAPAALDSLWLILLARAVLGVAAAAVLISGLTGIGGLAPARRAQMLGLQTLVGGVSAMIIYPLAGALAQHGWRPAFLLHLVALVVIPLVLALPKGVRAQAHEPAAPKGEGLGLPPALLLVAAFIGMAMFIGGMFAPFYLTSIGISNPALLSIPPTVGAAVGLIAAAAYGWLHARLSRMTLFTLALGLVAAGLAISGVSPAMPMFVVGAGLAGAGATLFTPNLSAEAIARAPEGQAGRAVGLANGAIFCSQVVFPFIAMPLVHSAGPRGVYLAFAVVAALITVGFTWIAVRGRGAAAAGDPARAHPV